MDGKSAFKQRGKSEMVQIGGVLLLFLAEGKYCFSPPPLIQTEGQLLGLWEGEVVVREPNGGPERGCSRVWPYI
jgi:hypothetical protein